MTGSNLWQPGEERSLPPPLADTELAARLAALERRERELERAVGAVDAQRLRLEEVRAEYESRRDLLTCRAREVEEEHARLREERARLRSESIGRDEAPAAPAAARSAKPLGSPLEAA